MPSIYSNMLNILTQKHSRASILFLTKNSCIEESVRGKKDIKES